MTVDETYQAIVQQKPPLIFITGKTSTGKSTFGRQLHDTLGYRVVELEAVLLEIVRSRGLDEQATFHKVFHDPGESEVKSLFFEITDKVISDARMQEQPVVVEGAVANTKTLQRILRPSADLFFIYFHPEDINLYIRNLTSRFMQSSEASYGGLPRKFWQLVDDAEFKTFCQTRKLTDSLENSIRQYALASQRESVTRLNELQQRFNGIIVVRLLL